MIFIDENKLKKRIIHVKFLCFTITTSLAACQLFMHPFMYVWQMTLVTVIFIHQGAKFACLDERFSGVFKPRSLLCALLDHLTSAGIMSVLQTDSTFHPVHLLVIIQLSYNVLSPMKQGIYVFSNIHFSTCSSMSLCLLWLGCQNVWCVVIPCISSHVIDTRP
jgi:hypothetical protein